MIPLLEIALDNKSNNHVIWHQAWIAAINKSQHIYETGSYTNYASNVDGRQYLLQELPNIKQTYDWKT